MPWRTRKTCLKGFGLTVTKLRLKIQLKGPNEVLQWFSGGYLEVGGDGRKLKSPSDDVTGSKVVWGGEIMCQG